MMNSTLIAQGAQYIGTEVRDEPLFQDAWGCPAGAWCRNSDAAIIAFTAGISRAFGVAFTGLPVCTGWTNCESRLTIQGVVEVMDEDFAFVGEDLNKTGQRSGWTRGSVTETCKDRTYDSLYWPPAGSFITPIMLCQIYFGGFADSGDSGSPVYKRYTFTSGTPGYARMVGILWGRDNSIQRSFASPLNGISADLGPITTFP